MAENSHHFCVCITPGSLSPEARQALDGSRAALLNEARWPAGSVIRVKFLEGDSRLQNRVQQVAREWTGPGMANLTLNFVPDSEDADIRIAFAQGNGSWSYLGTTCLQILASEPTMNYGWLTPESTDQELRRVVLHEFGHALGLIHEHQNPRRAVRWNEDAVIRDLSGPPNNWDVETIRHNVLNRYAKQDVTSTNVDGKSIMMYPIPAAWTLDGFSAGFNGELSESDKRFIRRNYP
jgi:serralysin